MIQDLHGSISAGLSLPASILLSLAAPASSQERAWTRVLGTPVAESASMVASDGSGGVLVGGTTGGNLGGPSAGGEDAWVARYDRAGSQLWLRQFGTSLHDNVLAGAPDGASGVYLFGNQFSTGGAIEDVWLARYDGTGGQLWIQLFGTSSGDSAGGAAEDGAGGVYIAGNTEGDLGGSNAGGVDAWLARHDSSGNRLWIRQFGTASGDIAQGLAPDASGGVYVCGQTGGSLGSPLVGASDAWLARFDAAGNQLWIRQFGTVGHEAAHAAASDDAGGVFVGGNTDDSLGGPFSGGLHDAWLARYDSDGNPLWIRQPGTSEDDFVRAAAPDGRGGVYVAAGTSEMFPTGDLRMLRFDGAGSLLWEFESGTSYPDFLGGAAPDGAGGVYFAGGTSLFLAGSVAWLTLFLSGPCLTLDFQTEDDLVQPLVNGQHIDTEFGELVSITSTGPNAGLAIFDSTPGGPNDPSQDPDLLVGTGNLLILQTENYPPDENDVFPRPNDDDDGGTITFAFTLPVEARSVRLVDVDAGDGTITVRLTDTTAAQRIYTIPNQWTGDRTSAPPGHRKLNLSTLEPQEGLASTATATQDAGFDPTRVIQLDFVLAGSCGIDDLSLCLPASGTASMQDRDGSGVNPHSLSSVSLPVLGSAWMATLDCTDQGSGLAVLEIRRRASSGPITPFGEVLVSGPVLERVVRAHPGAVCTLDWAIPFDLALCGLEAHVQGACVGTSPALHPKLRGQRIALSNAIDLVLGF